MLEEQGIASDGETVVALARRRFGALLAAEPEIGERRLAGFLARRGHDWETIAKITKEVCGDAGRGVDPVDTSAGAGETGCDG